MKINRKTIILLIGAGGLTAAIPWLFSFAQHYKVIVPPTSFKEGIKSQEVQASFKTHIQPILEQKCVQCHTNTQDRPFFYSVPLINLYTKPYVDGEIHEGREKFDFTNGLDAERLGSAMEAVLALRHAVQEDSMPPREYRWARPSHLLNDQEKEMILEWTQQASLAMEDEMFEGTALGQDDLPTDEEEFGKAMAESIIATSPLADPADKKAKDEAAERIAQNPFLKARMNSPFLWGGQKAPGNFNLYDAHLTRFNPLVWRKYYLSLFMFEGGYEVVKNGDLSAYIFPIRFRSSLGDGEYPYPFWHSEAKWQKYNEAKNLIIFVKEGKIVASMRSADKKAVIPPYAKRSWDGNFRWMDEKTQVMQPRVNNFDTLFSASNPFLPELEKNYQQLALAFRSENCLVCHSPNNKAKMGMLELLSSPVHALDSRDRLLGILDKNVMPPLKGIQDHEVKGTFTELAREFKKLGDAALRYENEPIKDGLMTHSKSMDQHSSLAGD